MMCDETTPVQQLKAFITAFCEARGWSDETVNAKDLVMALSVEASELLEIFQWTHSDDAENILHDDMRFTHMREEIADVLWYLIRLCVHFDIDITQAVQDKAVKNGRKYPPLPEK